MRNFTIFEDEIILNEYFQKKGCLSSNLDSAPENEESLNVKTCLYLMETVFERDILLKAIKDVKKDTQNNQFFLLFGESNTESNELLFAIRLRKQANNNGQEYHSGKQVVIAAYSIKVVLVSRYMEFINDISLTLKNYFKKDELANIQTIVKTSQQTVQILNQLLDRFYFEDPILACEQFYSQLLDEAVNRKLEPTSFYSELKRISKKSTINFLLHLFMTAGMFTNITMYSRYSKDTLTSGGVVLTFSRVLWALGGAPLSAVQINLSNTLTKKPKEAGRVIQVGWLLSLALGTCCASIAYYGTGPLLRLLGQSPNTIKSSENTFRPLALAFLGYSIMSANSKVLIAMDRMPYVLVSNFISSVIGTSSVYLLIYGDKLGLNSLGGERGYGWGMSIQFWSTILPSFAYILFKGSHQHNILSYHKGFLNELYKNFKEGMAILMQTSAEIFAAFGLNVYAGLIGDNALTIENVVETYRMLFGRMGGSAIAQIVSVNISYLHGYLDLMSQDRLRTNIADLPNKVINSISYIRRAGFVNGITYGALWLLLYATMPRQLASVIIPSGMQEKNVMSELDKVFLIAGAGQLFDNIEQAQRANLNSHKDLFVSSITPLLINLGLMLGMAYPMGVETNNTKGLEAANLICFISATLAFSCLLSHSLKKVKNTVASTILNDRKDEPSIQSDDGQCSFALISSNTSSIWYETDASINFQEDSNCTPLLKNEGSDL